MRLYHADGEENTKSEAVANEFLDTLEKAFGAENAIKLFQAGFTEDEFKTVFDIGTRYGFKIEIEGAEPAKPAADISADKEPKPAPDPEPEKNGVDAGKEDTKENKAESSEKEDEEKKLEKLEMSILSAFDKKLSELDKKISKLSNQRYAPAPVTNAADKKPTGGFIARLQHGDFNK